MSASFELFLVCLCMVAGTLCFGLLPLALRFSRLTLRLLEVSGAGLLLGAAGSVVLPEGAGTLFRANAAHQHDSRARYTSSPRRAEDATASYVQSAEPESLLAISFLTGMLLLFVIDQIIDPDPHCNGESHYHDCEPEEDHRQHHLHHSSQEQQQQSFSQSHHHRPPRCRLEHDLSRISRPESMVLTRSNAVPALHSLEDSGYRHYCGESAILSQPPTRGYYASSHSRHDSEGSVASLPSDYHTLSHQDNVEEAFFHHKQQSQTPGKHALGSSTSSPLLQAAQSLSSSPPRRSLSAFERDRSSQSQRHGEKSRGLRGAFTSIAGLLIHAACDGIAMGASAASQDQGLKLVVLGAIMIHKAPAAFGLCTLLLSQRLSRVDIKKTIAIFSLATPFGTLITYLLLSLLMAGDAARSDADIADGWRSTEPAVSSSHVGIALSFSAGSFLYVALDAVRELASSSSDYEVDAQGIQLPKQVLYRTGRIVTLLVGAIIPKGLQLAFGHRH